MTHTELIIIRHGQTDWNLNGKWQGLTNTPLNAKGIMQAEQIAGRLKKFLN